MHVIAGFESQIAARGGALAIIDSARRRGLGVCGAALARRDTERAIHVDPLRGFEMPEHVLQALDDVVDETNGASRLRRGETALIVAISGGPDDDAASVFDFAALESLGPLWVSLSTPGA